MFTRKRAMFSLVCSAGDTTWLEDKTRNARLRVTECHLLRKQEMCLSKIILHQYRYICQYLYLK